MAPAPNRFHQDVSKAIEFLIQRHLREHSIGEAYHAPFDVYLDTFNVYQPDICFFSKDRFHLLSDRGAEGPPDLVIEILSPRNRQLDETVKKDIYAQKGVRELWLVDPETKTVSVYDLAVTAETVHLTFDEAGRYESSLLPGLVFYGKEVFYQRV